MSASVGKKKETFDPAAFLAKAGKGKTNTRYRKGQVVFAQSDAANAVFYVQTGQLKLTVVSNSGKEAVVALLGAGDFFGEGCLAGQQVRMATATAMSECAIVRIERAEAVRVLRDEPAFSELFLKYLLSRNIRIEEDLVDQLFNSSEKVWPECFCSWRTLAKKGNPRK
jgi:CRP-like cAMP-binding protein